MTYEFTDETKAYIAFVTQMSPLYDLTVQALRQQNEKLYSKINSKMNSKFKGEQKEQLIRTETTELPVTIYKPVDGKFDKMVIFFHGGGGIMGSRRTHQTIVNLLADATKIVWISVEFRCAPEFKYPVFLDDCLDATRYIISNKQDFGANESTKFGLVGDSMGATIAASLSHALKDKIHFQILVYGSFDFNAKTASFHEFQGEQFMATPEIMEFVKSNTFANESDLQNPRASVLLHTSFEQLPPALFIVSEFDPLRDDSYEYQRILNQAGVRTELVLIKGVIHSFFGFPGIFRSACGQTSDAICGFLDTLDTPQY